MENPNEYNSLKEFYERFAFVGASFFIALIGKISNEILMNRKLSFMSWCAIIGVSMLGAWLMILFCREREYGPEKSGMLVAAATLMSEKIVIYLHQNFKQLFTKFISLITPSKK